jgi:GDP-D-mannose 3',5'-epimerase
MAAERVLVTGGAGFIGSYMSIFLRKKGYWVRCVDWAENEFLRPQTFCNEFMQLDLRVYDNCKTACNGVDWVFHFAADIGGIGFTSKNNPAIVYNNLFMSLYMLDAARRSGVKRFFYASSASVYPDAIPIDAGPIAWKEQDAGTGPVQNGYAIEKIVTEQLCHQYMAGFHMETRVGRLHTVYGPGMPWRGGREKAPAALIRKAIVATAELRIWGDGKQIRSFTYIDDCTEGIWLLFRSDYRKPLNIGASRSITMEKLAKLALTLADKTSVQVTGGMGPEGVRSRASDNTLIIEVLHWEPKRALKAGMKLTYNWMVAQIEAAKKNGEDVSKYAQSTVVQNPKIPELGQLRTKASQY